MTPSACVDEVPSLLVVVSDAAGPLGPSGPFVYEFVVPVPASEKLPPDGSVEYRDPSSYVVVDGAFGFSTVLGSELMVWSPGAVYPAEFSPSLWLVTPSACVDEVPSELVVDSLTGCPSGPFVYEFVVPVPASEKLPPDGSVEYLDPSSYVVVDGALESSGLDVGSELIDSSPGAAYPAEFSPSLWLVVPSEEVDEVPSEFVVDSLTGCPSGPFVYELVVPVPASEKLPPDGSVEFRDPSSYVVVDGALSFSGLEVGSELID